MAKETLLLTGATGMIGFRMLVQLLEQDRFHIRVAVRSQESFEKLTSYKPLSPYVSLLESVIVPDISVPGAYDEVVKGVTHIVHVASPIPGSNTKDGDLDIIEPAIRGTVGILESAHKTTGVVKVVITASLASIASTEYIQSGGTVNEETRVSHPKGPFGPDIVSAYSASKALSFEATDDFIAKNKPAFNVVRILPSFVIGRDDTVTDASQIIRGTNTLVIGSLLGQPPQWQPKTRCTVHLDDVAKLHLIALDPAITDNRDYLAASADPHGWGETFDIVKKRYPDEYAAGVFKIDSVERPESTPASVDSSKATKELGFVFKTFEEQVTSVVDHYLELLAAKR